LHSNVILSNNTCRVFQCVSIVNRCYLMAAHDIFFCISCLGYNEKGFQAVKQNVPPTVLSDGRVGKEKKEPKKEGTPRRNLKFKPLSARFILLAKSFAEYIGQRDWKRGYNFIVSRPRLRRHWDYMNCEKSIWYFIMLLRHASQGKNYIVKYRY